MRIIIATLCTLFMLASAPSAEARQYVYDPDALYPFMQAWPDAYDPTGGKPETVSPRQAKLNLKRMALPAPTSEIREEAKASFADGLPWQMTYRDEAIAIAFGTDASRIMSAQWSSRGLDTSNFGDCLAALALSSHNVAKGNAPGLKGFSSAQIKGVRDQMRRHVSSILSADFPTRNLEIAAEEMRAEFMLQQILITLSERGGEPRSEVSEFLLERANDQYGFDVAEMDLHATNGFR